MLPSFLPAPRGRSFSLVFCEVAEQEMARTVQHGRYWGVNCSVPLADSFALLMPWVLLRVHWGQLALSVLMLHRYIPSDRCKIIIPHQPHNLLLYLTKLIKWLLFSNCLLRR